MKYLSVRDVECMMCFRVFHSANDKKDFIKYLFYYKLISEKTMEKLLKEL